MPKITRRVLSLPEVVESSFQPLPFTSVVLPFSEVIIDIGHILVLGCHFV